jgi:hypothetical protein
MTARHTAASWGLRHNRCRQNHGAEQEMLDRTGARVGASHQTRAAVTAARSCCFQKQKGRAATTRPGW